MTMTRKDFKLIAACIADQLSYTHSPDGALAIERLAKELATCLYYSNPRFDKDQFMAAALLKRAS
jgi:hypothetical protein